MKNKYLIIAIVVLSVIAIISSPSKKTTFFKEKNKDNINLTIKNQETNEENIIDLEEYVIGVVAGEMPALFDEEALKAQAIASRTYAIYKMNNKTTSYDLTTDISNQVYITKEEMQEKWGSDFQKCYQKVKQAINDTKGLIMESNGKVISSFYFAISNGKTEDVSLVFGEQKDYLVSVDSKWDENVKNFEVTTNLSKKEFCTKLDISCDKINIKNIEKSDSGRVNKITINNKIFKGTEIRKILNLRSTDFEINITNEVSITTKGYGHGVGMSQYGANEMAKSGKTYEEILKYYYKDINITKL